MRLRWPCLACWPGAGGSRPGGQTALRPWIAGLVWAELGNLWTCCGRLWMLRRDRFRLQRGIYWADCYLACKDAASCGQTAVRKNPLTGPLTGLDWDSAPARQLVRQA